MVARDSQGRPTGDCRVIAVAHVTATRRDGEPLTGLGGSRSSLLDDTTLATRPRRGPLTGLGGPHHTLLDDTPGTTHRSGLGRAQGDRVGADMTCPVAPTGQTRPGGVSGDRVGWWEETLPRPGRRLVAWFGSHMTRAVDGFSEVAPGEYEMPVEIALDSTDPAPTLTVALREWNGRAEVTRLAVAADWTVLPGAGCGCAGADAYLHVSSHPSRFPGWRQIDIEPMREPEFPLITHVGDGEFFWTKALGDVSVPRGGSMVDLGLTAPGRWSVLLSSGVPGPHRVWVVGSRGHFARRALSANLLVDFE